MFAPIALMSGRSLRQMNENSAEIVAVTARYTDPLMGTGE